VADRKAAAEAKKAKAQANAVKAKKDALEKAKAAAGAPGEMFKALPKYAGAEFGADGIPTKLANGDEVSKGEQKKLGKGLAKQQKDHDKLAASAGGDIAAHIAKLQADFDAASAAV
jgi:cysteinyl-tRNA synthetase